MTWKSAVRMIQVRMSSWVGAGESATVKPGGGGGGLLVGTYPYRDDATIRITKQIHTSFTAHNSIRLCDKHIPNSQWGFLFWTWLQQREEGGGMQTVHSRFTAQDIPPKQYSWNTAIYCIDPKIQPASYLNDWSLIRGYVDHQAQERIESISVFTASTPPLEYKHYFILTLLKKKN